VFPVDITIDVLRLLVLISETVHSRRIKIIVLIQMRGIARAWINQVIVS
jgi:hypothetical protein